MVDPQPRDGVDPEADFPHFEVLGLGHHAAAVGADMGDGGGVAVGALEAGGLVGAAEGDGVQLVAVGARDVPGDAGVGFGLAVFDVAEAFELGRCAGD